MKAVWKQPLLDKARDMQRYILRENEWRDDLRQEVEQIRANATEANRGEYQSQQQQEASAQQFA